MNKVKYIESCSNCGFELTNIEKIIDTDVSDGSLMSHEPWDGTYYISYKICPRCNEKSKIFEWFSGLNGWEKLKEKYG